jgi:hypothetical protein
MKKFMFLLLLSLAGMSASAQYGHRTYYIDSLTNEWFNDGLITDQFLAGGLPVYVACGKAKSIVAGATERSRFMRARFSGTTQQNRLYYIFKNGAELPSRLNSICESGNSFVMSGSANSSNASTPGGGDIMVMKTSASGIPSSLWKVDLNNGFDEALCTRRSKYKASNYFTCGYSSTPNVSSAFLMKHNSTMSTISWVRKFNIPCGSLTVGNAEATSVIDDGTTGSVVVIGNIKTNVVPVNCQSAFIAKFNAGGVLQWFRTIGAANTTAVSLQSIRETDVNGEYVITGSVGLSGSGDRVLLMRVNTNGAAPVIVFARGLLSAGPSPNFPVSAQNGYDVVTRKDSNVVEYYVAGSTGYTFGQTDGMLLKTNGAGIPLALRLYMGNGSEALYAIDQTNQYGTPGDGIAAFGRYDRTFASGIAPANRSWLAKSYFNLVTGCNEIPDNPTSVTLNISFTTFTPSFTTTFTKDSLQWQYGNALSDVVCWATSVAGGSNLRRGAEENAGVSSGDLSVSVYPNPVAGNSLQLHLVSTMEDLVTVRIIDAMGRLMDEHSLLVQEGDNEAGIDITEMRSGVCIVQVITSTGKSKNIRVVKQ